MPNIFLLLFLKKKIVSIKTGSYRCDMLKLEAWIKKIKMFDWIGK